MPMNSNSPADLPEAGPDCSSRRPTTSALLAGVNGSYGGVGGLYDLQLKPVDRLFLDCNLAYFHYPDLTTYIGPNPRFPGELPGNNASNMDNHIRPRVYDFYGDATFKFLLPIGGGRDTIIKHYTLENGLYQSGGTGGAGWNPLRTGQTFLQLTPFFEYDKLNTDKESQSFNCGGAGSALSTTTPILN